MDDRAKADLAMKGFYSYDPNRHCSKCGGADVGTLYEPGHNCGDVHCGSQCPELLVRTCRRCHYEWIEGVKNASSNNGQLG
jgi:hypothetical protein